MGRGLLAADREAVVEAEGADRVRAVPDPDRDGAADGFALGIAHPLPFICMEYFIADLHFSGRTILHRGLLLCLESPWGEGSKCERGHALSGSSLKCSAALRHAACM